MTVGKPLTVKKATSGGYMGVFGPFDLLFYLYRKFKLIDMRRVFLFLSLLLATGVSAQLFQISSPEGRIQMAVCFEKTMS